MPGPVLDTGDMEMSTLPWPPQEILALGLEIVAGAMDEVGILHLRQEHHRRRRKLLTVSM